MAEAKAQKPPKGQPLAADPVFQVLETRPEKPVTLSPTGDGKRPNRPLTDALLKTLNGGSILVSYDRESHRRLAGRFKTVESRLKNIVVKYSLVLDEKKEPVKVQWWCEKKAPKESPPPPPKESVVGRDTE